MTSRLWLQVLWCCARCVLPTVATVAVWTGLQVAAEISPSPLRTLIEYRVGRWSPSTILAIILMCASVGVSGRMVASLHSRVVAAKGLICPRCMYILRHQREKALCSECGFWADAFALRRAWTWWFGAIPKA